MLKRWARGLVAVLGVVLLAGVVHAAPEAGAQPVSVAEQVAGERDEPVLIVHYYRPDGQYDRWNVWTWGVGEEGRGVAFDRETAFGRYAVIELDDDASRQGLLLRRGNWEQRDVPQDRFVELDDDGVTEVWLVSGNPSVFMNPDAVDVSTRIVGAFLDAGDEILLTVSTPLTQEQLDGITVLHENVPNRYKADSVVRSEALVTQGVAYTVRLDKPVADRDVAKLSVSIPGIGTIATVYARDVLTELRFTALEARLGAVYSREATTFRVWSPVADAVDVLLYREHDDRRPAVVRRLSREARGLWSVTLEGDLHGRAYRFRYRSYGEDRVAPDIHARAATNDSSKSIVVDLSRTHPEGWATVEPPRLESPTDEVIYEIHVRDFSIDDPSTPAAHRGMYEGLIHRGSVSTPDGTVATGLAHLEELGVTAVHLLPIHDYTGERDQYNWGYWTALFNVPESNYASRVDEPMLAITELKRAIHGLHEAGIRVILDVVYNHTSTSGEWSPFFQSVPYYWFRTTPDGVLRNDAGVGNSLADERPMVRKYIEDSLAYWTTEYRVDGFRFDLIGTHKPSSVRKWVERVRRLRPDLTIYGEPWTGGGPLYFGKGMQKRVGLAVFNDHLRNALRGDLDGKATGFATGRGGDVAAVKRGVMGAIDDFTASPTETINYVSAHDNLTFWDKLVLAQPDATDEQRLAMHRLAHAAVLTSQGIAFIHGGADYARTKGGNHNSYNAGDDVNRFDWERKAEFAETVDYIAGLIELRTSRALLRLDSAEAVRDALRWHDEGAGDDVISYTLRAPGEKAMFIAYNGSPREQVIELPEGAWRVLADDDEASATPLRTSGDSYTMPAYSALVLAR
jgi:pullulanase